MNILILNDCVSPDTDTFSLLRGICHGIQKSHEIEWVNIHDLNMKNCRKCFKCQPCGECVLPEDDAHEIGRKIFKTDALVIGLEFPIQNISLQLKNLFDRCASNIAVQKMDGNITPWRKDRPVAIASLKTRSLVARIFNRMVGNDHCYLMRTLKDGGFKLICNFGVRPNKKIIHRELLFEKAIFLGSRLFHNDICSLNFLVYMHSFYSLYQNLIRKTMASLKTHVLEK